MEQGREPLKKQSEYNWRNCFPWVKKNTRGREVLKKCRKNKTKSKIKTLKQHKKAKPNETPQRNWGKIFDWKKLWSLVIEAIAEKEAEFRKIRKGVENDGEYSCLKHNWTGRYVSLKTKPNG